MSKSKIEWTEQTVNPIIGCSKCSPACQNCYALTMARRLSGMKCPVGDDYRRVVTDGEWNGKTVFIPGVLYKIIKRKKPTTYFIGSMGDIFHESVPDDWIDQVMATIAICPQHRFMVLTKRPERMREYFNYEMHGETRQYHIAVSANWMMDSEGFDVVMDGDWPLKNLALGVSVWDQGSADHAIPLLLQTPAARRFVSAEPLLGLIDAGVGDLSKLDLVIVGGETGPGARPIHPNWARSLRDQCSVAGVPFMFKQWGEWTEKVCGCIREFGPDQLRWVRKSGGCSIIGIGEKHDDSILMYHVGKKSAGRLLDGVEHNGAIQWEVAE